MQFVTHRILNTISGRVDFKGSSAALDIWKRSHTIGAHHIKQSKARSELLFKPDAGEFERPIVTRHVREMPFEGGVQHTVTFTETRELVTIFSNDAIQRNHGPDAKPGALAYITDDRARRDEANRLEIVKRYQAQKLC